MESLHAHILILSELPNHLTLLTLIPPVRVRANKRPDREIFLICITNVDGCFYERSRERGHAHNFKLDPLYLVTNASDFIRMYLQSFHRYVAFVGSFQFDPTQPSLYKVDAGSSKAADRTVWRYVITSQDRSAMRSCVSENKRAAFTSEKRPARKPKS